MGQIPRSTERILVVNVNVTKYMSQESVRLSIRPQRTTGLFGNGRVG